MLQQLFPVNRIKVDLESVEKEELFEELVDMLVRTSAKPLPRSDVLACVLEREIKMSTGIIPGIALPHGKCAGIDGIIGAAGISRHGIDYEALDGKPVHAVFMLVSSVSDAEQHLRALKRLALVLEAPEFFREFIASDTGGKAFTTLQRYEELLTTQG